MNMYDKIKREHRQKRKHANRYQKNTSNKKTHRHKKAPWRGLYERLVKKL